LLRGNLLSDVGKQVPFHDISMTALLHSEREREGERWRVLCSQHVDTHVERIAMQAKDQGGGEESQYPA